MRLDPHLHKIGEGFGEILWNERLGHMPRVYKGKDSTFSALPFKMH